MEPKFPPGPRKALSASRMRKWAKWATFDKVGSLGALFPFIVMLIPEMSTEKGGRACEDSRKVQR